MPKDKKIQNAFKRSEVHRKTKLEKGQAKLQRRLEIKKAEKDKVTGAALRAERLSKNIPVTLDNTRVYDSSSYLTANPASLQNLAKKATEASALVNEDDLMGKQSSKELSSREDSAVLRSGPSSDQEEDVGESSEMPDWEIEEKVDGEDQEASAMRDITTQSSPRILITTSPSPCKQTYQFCDDLKNVFPGGEFFKRPKGRGFEIGRVSRWASKRGYQEIFRCCHLNKSAVRTHCVLQAFQYNTFVQHLRACSSHSPLPGAHTEQFHNPSWKQCWATVWVPFPTPAAISRASSCHFT